MFLHARFPTCVGRVRATISANQCDGAGVLSFGHEPLVATLNNPWHVLEPLGHETLAALAVREQINRADAAFTLRSQGSFSPPQLPSYP